MAKAMSFSLPTIPCGAAKPWAVISWSSMPCSTSTTSTLAAPPLLPQNNCRARNKNFILVGTAWSLPRLSGRPCAPRFSSGGLPRFLRSGSCRTDLCFSLSFSPLFPATLSSPQDSVTMLRGGSMSKSRRHFLTQTSLGLLGAAVAANTSVHAHADELPQDSTQLPPGAPPAFGTGPAVGPEVSPATFAEAEKLVQINLTTADRTLAAETWRVNLASLYERRTGPHTITLEPTVAPFSRYHSVLPGQPAGPQRDQFVRTKTA